MANALLDFLQGASNSAAANVSAPVDGIAWLLRKAGINVDRPVMGSDWMRERGLTAEPTNKLAGILGESVGGVLPMVTAAKAPQIAQGLLQAERNLAAPTYLDKEFGGVYGGKKTNVEFASVSDNPEKWAYKQKKDLTSFQKVGEANGFDLYHQPANTTTRAGYNPEYEGHGTIIAVSKDGKIVGDTFYGPWNGRRSANALEGAVEVHPDYRRQGVASAMYDKIEAMTGLKMKAAPTHTPLAEAFWESRNGQPLK